MKSYICIILGVVHCVCAESVQEGYYWRNYDGKTPEDAVPGGLDSSGIPIYIGQVLYGMHLITGKIYLNGREIHFPWDYEKKETDNIMILCSQYPEKFKWISSTPAEIFTFTKKFLVKGGYQENMASYIGRIFSGGETAIGKVICEYTKCLGLFLPINGKQVLIQSTFDVLTFDPSSSE